MTDEASQETEDDVKYDDRELQIVNEFAEVMVRKVYTAQGERLELSSPKLHQSIRLDSTALESLTWQDPEFFDELLEDPYG